MDTAEHDLRGELLPVQVLEQELGRYRQFFRIDAIEDAETLAILGGIGIHDAKLFERHQVAGDRAVVRRQCPSNIARGRALGMRRQVAKNFGPQGRHAKNLDHLGHPLRRLRV